jgi:Outer membrane protein beta-barrel domain
VLNYFLRIRQSIVPLFSILLAAGSLSAHAQVVPSAYKSQFSLTVGGMASAFQPDYDATYTGGNIAEASPYYLFGIGTYVDVKFSRWIQIEGEARWLRYNQFDQIYQDNYLIGPRLPIRRFHLLRSTVYAKGLIGLAKMDLGNYVTNEGIVIPLGHGSFTDVAFGGGVDVKLTKKFSIRLFDGEYQFYPKFIKDSMGQNQPIRPYGASVGVGYKIF